MMGLLDAVERTLERITENLFLRFWRQGVHPVQIARAIVRAMEDSRRVSVTRIYVPNDFEVELNPADHEALADIAGALASELGGYAQREAERRGYSLVGPVSLRLVASEKLQRGTVKVVSRFLEVQASFSRGREGLSAGSAAHTRPTGPMDGGKR